MRKFVSTLFAILLGLIFVTFAVANRHFVTVSFDPFNSANPSLYVKMPMFALIIVVAILGVVAGGWATWFGQRHWRRTARRLETEAADARLQLADLRLKLAPPIAPSRSGAAPAAQPSYPAIGQDKQGATL